MAVKEYSQKANGAEKLSKNFKVKEFRCKDGSDTILIDGLLVSILQSIREHFGKPVVITSAYRTEIYNKKVGGAPKSYHIKGQAADIKVTGVSPANVAKYAEQIGVKGIGKYGSFTHVDTRTVKYYWCKTGSNSVATFQ